MTVLWLVAGLAGLWLGSDFIVKGAIGIAARLRMSPLLIGATIVTVGTNVPELLVALRASLLSLDGTDASGLIVGNAIGSAVAQITLVAGAVALASRLTVDRRQLTGLGMGAVGTIVLVWALSFDGVIGAVDGLVALVGFAAYVWLMLRLALVRDDGPVQPLRRSPMSDWLKLLVGLISVTFAADLVVANAMVLVSIWGLSQTMVGALVIGLGTSLPELAVAVQAAFRGQPGLSIGNLVGSNIYDTVIPIGASALIHPVLIGPPARYFDLPYLMLVTLLPLAVLYTRREIGRLTGAAMIGAFLPYAWFHVSADTLT